ncbi:MAG: hypothetical protein NZM04_04945 [Methylacidiphilales bacterium]|nr:hypothetical protein [Candidatus Methylacidiphilales bacterium]
MGARNDGKAYVKAKLGIPLPQEHKDKVIFRLAKNGHQIMNGSHTYNPSDKTVSITADGLSDEADYFIVCGYDKNNNGKLEAAEKNIVDDIKLKIVSREKYHSAINTLKNFPLNVFPNALNLVEAFASSTTPEGAIATPTTIYQNENGLTHNVGVLFKPEANPGDSITANFAHRSELLQGVIKSHTFNNWLKGRLNERRAEVQEKLTKIPPNQNTVWFEWRYPKQGFQFSIVPDSDLFLALGKVSFNMTIQVPVIEMDM